MDGVERVTVGHVGPMKNEYVDSGVPFLRSQNVRENLYRPDGLQFISPKFHQKIVELNLLGMLHVSQASNAVMQKQPQGGWGTVNRQPWAFAQMIGV